APRPPLILGSSQPQLTYPGLSTSQYQQSDYVPISVQGQHQAVAANFHYAPDERTNYAVRQQSYSAPQYQRVPKSSLAGTFGPQQVFFFLFGTFRLIKSHRQSLLLR